jgi:hypothetical protein
VIDGRKNEKNKKIEEKRKKKRATCEQQGRFWDV